MLEGQSSTKAAPGWRQFWSDEGGATAIEYGLLAAMIAAFLVASLVALGSAENSMYTKWTEAANDAIAGSP
jgi:Flp pilus assembly pilin Flp